MIHTQKNLELLDLELKFRSSYLGCSVIYNIKKCPENKKPKLENDFPSFFRKGFAQKMDLCFVFIFFCTELKIKKKRFTFKNILLLASLDVR